MAEAPPDGPRPDAATGSVVHLRVPSDARFLRIVRLTTAALAADLDLDIEAIEDLRVAVDELGAALIEGVPPEAELELELTLDGDRLTVRGTLDGPPDDESFGLHPVAVSLLDMVARSYGVACEDGRRTFWLEARPDQGERRPG